MTSVAHSRSGASQAEAAPVRMIYLMASPNSGSTLVATLANAHPGLHSPGELMGPGGQTHGPQGPACSCGVVVAECPFWSEVGRRMAARGHWWRPDEWGLMHDRGHRDNPAWARLMFGRPGPRLRRDQVLRWVPGLGGRIRDMNARNRDIARIVLDLAGKGCLLDTSKPPERMIRLVHTPGLDVRVVHMVRDPRGWCNSRKKAGQADVRLTAQEWVKRNAYMARLVESLPPHRWMRVRYEGLCEAPAETFNAIYALGDLPPAPLPEDMSQLRTHLLGNTMRLRGDRTIRLDTAWREKLTAEEIAAIETVTAPLARRFGYEF